MILLIFRFGVILSGAGCAIFLIVGVVGGIENELDAISAARFEVVLALGGIAIIALVARLYGFSVVVFVLAIWGGELLWPAWRSSPEVAAECLEDALTISTANIESRERPWAEIIDALIDIDADVLALQEVSPSFLRSADLLRLRYPYSSPDVNKTGIRVVIWSKRPFVTAPTPREGLASAPMHAGGAIGFAGAPLGILALHVSRPIVGTQSADLEKLSPIFRQMTEPRRLVLGDFNAAPWSDVVRLVESETSTSFHGGFMRTWRGKYPTPWPGRKIPAPFGNQIDHILASYDLHLDSFRTHDLPGSVHLAVSARVRAVKPDRRCWDD